MSYEVIHTTAVDPSLDGLLAESMTEMNEPAVSTTTEPTVRGLMDLAEYSYEGVDHV